MASFVHLEHVDILKKNENYSNDTGRKVFWSITTCFHGWKESLWTQMVNNSTKQTTTTNFKYVDFTTMYSACYVSSIHGFIHVFSAGAGVLS